MVNKDKYTPDQLAKLSFSKEELKELAIARSMDICFDTECPEVTPEKAIKFRRVNPPRKDTRFA